MAQQKAKAGFLFIGCGRFRQLGAGCKDGTYEERRGRFVQSLLGQLSDLADCVFPGVAYTREDIDSAMVTFRREKVDCVVCSFLSWSEDFNWIYFLREMYDIPMAYFFPAVKAVPFKDTRDENDFVEFLAQGGLVGALIASSSTVRQNRPMTVIVDTPECARPKLATFFNAAKTRAKLRTAKYGLVANYNPIMRGTFIDPYDMFTRIGPELDFISYAKLKEETDKITDAEAEAFIADLRRKYVIEDDVAPKLLLESVRASLGLESLRRIFGLDALILNDVSVEIFETLGLRPGFYPDTFNANNAILVPEGDLGAGTAVYILKQLTGCHVNYIEPFYIQKDKGLFSAGHAGPHDYTDERYRDQVRISRDTRFAKTSYRYAGAPFAWYRIPAGLKTIIHFSEANNRFKLVAFCAESLPGTHELCSYCHSDFKVRGDAAELFEKVLSVGVTQHFACVEGDVTAELRKLAEICDFDYHEF